MDFDPARLRRGEILAGAGAVLLLVFLLAGKWYGHGAHARTGWEALTTLRWLLLVTILAAFGLVVTQITRRAPAVPVTMSLIVTVLGLVAVLAIIFRVLISPITVTIRLIVTGTAGDRRVICVITSRNAARIVTNTSQRTVVSACQPVRAWAPCPYHSPASRKTSSSTAPAPASSSPRRSRAGSKVIRPASRTRTPARRRAAGRPMRPTRPAGRAW